jgi:hypothetical protein
VSKRLNPEPRPPEALRNIQSWMSEAVSSLPEESHSNTVEAFIVPSRHLSASERLDIYVGDFWPRCVDSLAEDYPKLEAYLGETTFHEWMERYLNAYPSTHYTLYFLGENLGRFFSHHYDESDRDLVLDIITYEWAIAALYFAPELPRFDPSRISAEHQSRLPFAKLKLQPCTALLALNHPISSWDETEDLPPEKKTTYLLISRTDEFDTDEESLGYPEYRLLQSLNTGKSISEMLDLVPLLESEGHTVSSENIQQLFSFCVQKGWLIHPDFNEEHKHG